MRKHLSFLLLTLSLVFVSSTQVYASEAKGLEIANERKARDKGWGDSESKTTMILRNAKGDESKREIRSAVLEMPNDGDKGLTIFDEPKDVRGTAFLSHSHAKTEDDQWLYLPAVKRVKRIASRNKSGPFMGSEFAYEDFSSFEIEKFNFTYLRDETCNNQSCYVLEQTPTDTFSGYSKMYVWVDKEHYRLHKAEFYDRKSALLKTLTVSDYKLYLDKYWRPHLLRMQNHQTGKSTDLIMHEITFNTGRTEADFDTNALQRVR